MSEPEEEWTAVAQLLRAQLTESVWFSTFADVVPVAHDEEESLIIQVPSILARDRILTRYGPLITDAMSDLGFGARRFDVIAIAPDPSSSEPGSDDQLGAPGSAAAHHAPTGQPPTTRDFRAQSQSEVNASRRRLEAGFDDDALDEAGLNPRYTFETFVKGTSNQFALAAALRVAETPARSYNPLFIYGQAGLGKTHLLHAIGHYVHSNYQHHVVRYVSTETFMNEYVDAIRSNSMAGLRRRYREIDVLLIDDVQFLEGKEGLQEEFFHTFNSLHGANKQIIISSDRMPDNIPTLEERLRGRFGGGSSPTFSHPTSKRVSPFCGTKQNVNGCRCQPKPSSSSPPRFPPTSGSWKVRSSASPPTPASAANPSPPSSRNNSWPTCSPMLHPSRTDAELLDEIAKILGFEVEALKGKSRQRPLVTARQIAMYVFRDQTDLSYPSIARLFGGRDHTTVIHAVEKIQRQLSERKVVFEQVTDLIQKLKAS